MPRVGDRTTMIGIDCNNCGLNTGHFDYTGQKTQVRCDDCGQYAPTCDYYCGEHDVDIRKHPNYRECPKCKEKKKRREREQELHQRRASSRMHTSVDSQRF